MTAPIAHGYPDWGRYAARSDVLLLDLTGEAYTGVVTHQLGFVGGYEGIAFSFIAVVGPYRVRISYGTTALSSSIVTQYTFEFQSGGMTNVVLPILGPYCFIEVRGTGASTTYTITASTSQRDAIDQPASGKANAIINNYGQPIGAGATATATASVIWPGGAYLVVYCTGNNWVADVSALSYTGGNNFIDYLVSNGATETQHFLFLPCSQIQVRVTNNSGIAQTYYVFLVGRPIGPGW